MRNREGGLVDAGGMCVRFGNDSEMCKNTMGSFASDNESTPTFKIRSPIEGSIDGVETTRGRSCGFWMDISIVIRELCRINI